MRSVLPFHRVGQVDWRLAAPLILLLLLLHQKLLNTVLLILLIQLQVLYEGAIDLIVEVGQVLDYFGLFTQYFPLFRGVRGSNLTENERFALEIMLDAE